jgi:Hemerythrin HHE cation binding domain
MTESPPVRPDTSDMAAVHKVFRSSLATAPDFIDSAAGDAERRTLIANYYANLTAFLDAHHNGEEEIIFPRLIERAPEHRSTVERGERQHAEVVGLMLAVNESVALWEVKGDSEAPETLRCLHALDSVLSPHLDQEEAEIVPLAAEYLTVEEWGSLPGHAMGNFEGDKIWLIMGLIRENFTPEQRDAMLEHMPPPARQMWQNMGEASFSELIGQVRQTS